MTARMDITFITKMIGTKGYYNARKYESFRHARAEYNSPETKAFYANDAFC